MDEPAEHPATHPVPTAPGAHQVSAAPGAHQVSAAPTAHPAAPTANRDAGPVPARRAANPDAGPVPARRAANPDAGTPAAPEGSPRLGSSDAHKRGHPVEILGVPAPVFVSGRRDERVAAIAARQRGIVTRDQLRAAGIAEGVITRMARTGQLHRLHRGVFAVGHDALLPFARETAALLAVGEGAYLSHLSAARLWQIVPGEAQEVDVLRHPGRAHARPGIRLHEASHLEPRDTRTHEHLPVTSPARTVLDLADSLTGRPLEKAIAEAWALKLITNTSLRDILARANGHRGAATLAALAGLARHTRSRSVSEDHLLRLLRQAELPLPIMNAPLYGWNVDYYWPEHGLVLELDSYQFHSSRWAFDRDRRKSAALTARGLRVMHSTSEQVDETPFVVVGRIAQALAHARAA